MGNILDPLSDSRSISSTAEEDTESHTKEKTGSNENADTGTAEESAGAITSSHTSSDDCSDSKPSPEPAESSDKSKSEDLSDKSKSEDSSDKAKSDDSSDTTNPPVVPEVPLSTAEKASRVRPHAGDELNYEMLLQYIRGRRVIPFIGAGISMPTLPGWNPLLEGVGRRIGLDLDLSAPDTEHSTVVTEALQDAIRKRNLKAARKKADKLGSSNPKKSSSMSPRKDGHPTLERQKSRVVSGGLADELEAEFRDALLSKGEYADEMVESMVLAAPPPYDVRNESLRWTMQLPVALMSGPWPLVMTTNWDTFLETAFGLFRCRSMGSEPLDVWDKDHPSSEHFYRHSKFAVVRYRANVQEVFAELRAGVSPPRLLKLHGDFTEQGRRELVAGHADYRRLMCHGIAFTRLMQYMSSNYSFLFYGCSLTDPDVQAVLDSMVESLGGEVGPHFWLTADKVSQTRINYLRRNYSIFTIRTAEPYQFRELGQLLIDVCNKGWHVAKPLEFSSLSFKASSWLPGGPSFRIFVENSTPKKVLKRTKDIPAAAAISCGTTRHGMITVGNQAFAMLGKEDIAVHDVLRKTQFNPEKERLWRAIPVTKTSHKHWFVCGQDVGRSGSLRSAFDSIQHFVERASTYLHSGSMDPPEHSQRASHGDSLPTSVDEYMEKTGQAKPGASEDGTSRPERIVLCVPLISAGGGSLHSQEVFSATISALGDLCAKYLPPCNVDIVVCLATPVDKANGGRLALMSDIQGGRVVVGDILARSSNNHMEFTCIAPMELSCVAEETSESHQHWQCRRIVLPLSATLSDLQVEMNFITEDFDLDLSNSYYSPGLTLLLDLNITDGSVVKLDASGQVIQGSRESMRMRHPMRNLSPASSN